MKFPDYKPSYERSAALVIGINDYAYVNHLDIARADAEAIASVLVNELGFPQESTLTLFDGEATKGKILEQFLSFGSLGVDDRLLVFFAGHGETVEGYHGPIGYLVPVDGKPDDKSSLIRWDELTRNADLIPAKHVLFIMDACYSGLAIQRGESGGERRFVTDMLRRRSRQVITAGKANEPVADGGGPTGKNSMFTGHLLEGLRGKAASEAGVLTASLLMDYVYRKVSTDAGSHQTPHYGHLDGDGDFILVTPTNQHLNPGATDDFLVKTVVERPEFVPVISNFAIKLAFAEKNGYADPESETFGRNQWSNQLGIIRKVGGLDLVPAFGWLSLVVEPVSNEAVIFDIGNLAQSLPNSQCGFQNPWDRVRLPSQPRTTAKSLILFDQESAAGQDNRHFWKQFVRIEKDGPIEYCTSMGVASVWSKSSDTSRFKIFKYVQIVGAIWSFLYTVKRIFALANYQGGVRIFVNLVGTQGTILCDFAKSPGPNRDFWRQPFDPDAMFSNSLQNWTCQDRNLQIKSQYVLASFGEGEAKKLVVEYADYLGLAYNHRSKPRCFISGTDEFPWNQFIPHEV